ncbi:MAG: ATP-binding cassette domain-containing protein [Nitriliruptorales bacterium]|nr:ATP-binding cassette domain-containing protein [Nitriliruptorales bacterium]
MLKIADVHANYGTASILRGVDLDVASGEVVGLLGRNGMGKTTLVRTCAGLAPPRLVQGEITFDGQPIHGLPSYQIGAQGIGLVPQGRHVFGSLTVLENLQVAARAAKDGDDGWTLDRVYGLFPRLKDRFNSRARNLSGGEQQMLAIGRALMTNPKMLLMDEPSEGLAPIVLGVIRQQLQELKTQGLSILLVEQSLGMAERLCDRLYILGEGGVIVWEGVPADLNADERAKRVHLGV